MIEKIIQLIVAHLFSFAMVAQEDDAKAIKQISDEILVNGKAYENLWYLCKEIGPPA